MDHTSVYYGTLKPEIIDHLSQIYSTKRTKESRYLDNKIFYFTKIILNKRGIK